MASDALFVASDDFTRLFRFKKLVENQRANIKGELDLLDRFVTIAVPESAEDDEVAGILSKVLHDVLLIPEKGRCLRVVARR